MLDELYFRSGHLTAAAFAMLDCGGLTEEERILVLTHLEQCRDCMDGYVASLVDDALLVPPEGLEERIAGTVQEEYLIQKKKKTKLIQISKLAVAVCLTMVLSLSGLFPLLGGSTKKQSPGSPQTTYQAPEPKEYKPRENTLSDISGTINSNMNKFAAIFRNGFNFGGDGNNDADK